MAWPQAVERWRRLVLWECRDVPPDLVLAVIANESGGVPGAPGRRPTRCGMIPTADGGQVEVCRAYGLTQAIPATVDGYNRMQRDDPARVATFEDLSGKDERAARIQIAIGCYYLARVNHFLNQEIPDAAPADSLAHATGDQIRFVLAGYAVGHAAIAEKLAALARAGRPLTFAELRRAFPTWGQNQAGDWINKPLHFADRVASRFAANSSSSYTGGQAGALVARAKEQLGGGGLALVGILGGLAAWRWYQNRAERVENENSG